ncbi:MAG: HAD-IB family phosphatase, partial [Ignavibacterium sp.]|nr:HAD-IB family phosphatase [Ignavibacterium sp.]
HCEQFATKIIPGLIRPGAQKELDTLSQVGVTVVIVSASPENWVGKWSKRNSFDCIGTVLDIKNELITGKLVGKNCHGEEKVKRIKNRYNIGDYQAIYAYGDSKGDLPMLEIATDNFYKPFRS